MIKIEDTFQHINIYIYIYKLKLFNKTITLIFNFLTSYKKDEIFYLFY